MGEDVSCRVAPDRRERRLTIACTDRGRVEILGFKLPQPQLLSLIVRRNKELQIRCSPSVTF